MTSNQLELLDSRRFLPLFVSQALGAFNDNVFKNGIVSLSRFPWSNMRNQTLG